MKRFLLAWLVICGAGSGAIADMTLVGDSAMSGDTALLAMKDGHTVRFQIIGVEAPRPGQERFRESAAFLASLVKGKTVTVVGEKDTSTESETSYTAKALLIDGKDVGLAVIEAGWAWAGPGSRVAYGEAQASARGKKSGLWADPSPKEPWKWASKKKKKSK